MNAFGQDMGDVQPELRQLEVANREEFCETVLAVTTEFISTLNRQLVDCIDGKLSIESPEIAAQTASAPVHNMHAERTLGMLDAMMRRAPCASLLFNSAKVIAKQNCTLEWLESLQEDQQDQVVKFAVRQAGLVREEMAKRRRAAEEAVFEKYEQTVRDRYEKDLKSEVARVGLVPSLLNFYIFDKLSKETKDRLGMFLVDHTSLYDVFLRHVWHDKGKNNVYIEMIRNVKTDTNPQGSIRKVINLWFWKEDYTSTEDDIPSDEDDFCRMSPIQFLVDFAMGDVTFM